MAPNTPNAPQNSQGVYPLRRLYGRASGRPLSATQIKLIETLLPKVKINPSDPLFAMGAYSRLAFEIGFGGSEHLIWQAQHNPETGFLGAEPFIGGIAKALGAINSYGLENVRLHNGDARDILDMLPNESLDCVYILFPDPWPKSRHNKRRIIRTALIGEVYRVLKPKGVLRFASDIIDYVNWSLERINNFKTLEGAGFKWEALQSKDWLQRPKDWPPTRYEAKAIREGRVCHYFEFIKTY